MLAIVYYKVLTEFQWLGCVTAATSDMFQFPLKKQKHASDI